MSKNKPIGRIRVIYDGQCPFCAGFMRLWRIRDSITDNVDIVDARMEPALVSDFRRRGMEINDSMIVEIDDATYSGHAAMSVLAFLSSRSSTFNRMNGFIFRQPAVSRFLYPVLVFGRRVVLLVLGRRVIP
ncbi:DCC1-like thiol-disulfide oxidoreductase family protein [Parvibaculum sp.]|uniref:DCC1-like thiol-disulfide oxidoreductase family protein n=1 Tax=Parvibaculum sp. TaxID=2024848 RepID=UPI003C78952B